MKRGRSREKKHGGNQEAKTIRTGRRVETRKEKLKVDKKKSLEKN